MKFIRLSHFFAAATLVAAHAQTPAPRPKFEPVTPVQKSPEVAPAAVTVPPETVVLVVGDQKMTRAQFEAFVASLPEQLRANATGPNKRKFAEQLAELKSLSFEARRRKLDQTPDVQQKLALQTDNVLASELYRVLSANVKADDAALRAYYDQHKTEYEEATASHILIRFKGSSVPLRPNEKDLTDEEALAKAKDIRAKLAAGADFATLAKAESDDTGSGVNGGSLGSFARGRMVPVFEQTAFSLPVGQISEPVKSQFGYHIIKVEDRKSKTFDEVRPQIEGKLKPELARKAVEDVKKTVPVTIDDQYFGK